MTICLTAAGRRVHLIETLRDDAKRLEINLKLLALDTAPELSAACQKADIHGEVPPCSDPGYIDALVGICRRHGASLVIPTTDLDLQLLADARGQMADFGVTPIVSRSSAVRIIRDKASTMSALSSAGVPVPFTISLREAQSLRDKVCFPAIIKPIDGSSSKGIHLLSSWNDMPGGISDDSRYIFQEACAGREFTVNNFVDAQGNLACVVPHHRVEVRSGEVSKARTEKRKDFWDISRKIVSAIPGIRGPFCYQLILTESGPKVFEINARFGGGYPLAHAAGATFGKWLMEEALGLPSTANDKWADGLLMLRYDAAVFKMPHNRNEY